MTAGGGRPLADLEAPLRAAVEAGLMTLEEAWSVDDFAGEMATGVSSGELTRERAHAIVEERATKHAMSRGKA